MVRDGWMMSPGLFVAMCLIVGAAWVVAINAAVGAVLNAYDIRVTEKTQENHGSNYSSKSGQNGATGHNDYYTTGISPR